METPRVARGWIAPAGQLEKNEKMRAEGILEVVTSLGPTFIKIGQTLSIRPDIIPQVRPLSSSAALDGTRHHWRCLATHYDWGAWRRSWFLVG